MMQSSILCASSLMRLVGFNNDHNPAAKDIGGRFEERFEEGDRSGSTRSVPFGDGKKLAPLCWSSACAR
jgi:hypothetical protein